MRPNIFVLGLDELNQSTLRTLPNASSYRFHQLLTIDELQGQESIPLPELLDKAIGQLESFDGSIDAIVGYWDFPVSLMAPMLAERFGTRATSVESVLKCEHKYWSRLVQQQVIGEYPGFGVVDPDDESAAPPPGLSYPVWIKPVKSTSSESAYHVEDDEAFEQALKRERSEVGRMGEPFGWAMSTIDLPPEIAEVGGRACIVEEAATGAQVTVEGYVQNGHVEVYGTVDSIPHPDTSSFVRYQYPSSLAPEVRDRMATVSRRVVKAAGLDHTTFNIEFFWDAEREILTLLEVNARHSQSHARLFQMVDGLPNHSIMVDLAMGREPEIRHGSGPYDIAGKWFMRRFTDGVVRRVPSGNEIARLQQEVPGTTVGVRVEPGDRLSDLHGDSSYSYTLAMVYIGARDEDDLVHKYAQCVEALRFDIDEQEGAS